MPRYFLTHKPWGMLSQFTREAPQHRVLGDLFDFPPTVYPVGRLDRDSEGLLLLTDDKRLNAALLDPARQHPRTYWVQVEGTPSTAALAQLRAGVAIRVNKKVHHCAPVVADLLAPEAAAAIPARTPPVRYRATIPDAWLSLQLTEGKNRQVRRMCARVNLPVLRLIRTAIESVNLADLEGEAVREVSGSWLLPRLRLD